MGSTLNSSECAYNKSEIVADPQLCPRAVHLESNLGIVNNGPEIGKNELLRQSFADTRIDVLVKEHDNSTNLAAEDFLNESCPLNFQVDDIIGKTSDESLDLKSASYIDDCVDEAILRLKRDILSDDSDDEEIDDSDQLDSHVLSSTVLNQVKSPRLVPEQARQNILATLVHGVERRLEVRRRVTVDGACDNPKVNEDDTDELDINFLPSVEAPREIDEETETMIEEASSHLRESLLGVLEALKYVFQSTSETLNDDENVTDSSDSHVEVSQRLCDRATQTIRHTNKTGEEPVDIELLIAGLQEEFQRCLWVHQKITEDAHQLGFERGLQNAAFLQDLTEQSVQTIWSLREDRRQIEKYMKEKEKDWKTMNRAFTQEILDLRRENYQLISNEASKEGANGGRRIKAQNLKTLLKAKHDLERAFSLNVERQDKINELKMLVLKQQKCIRSLQERLIEDQASNMLLRYENRDELQDKQEDEQPDLPTTSKETNYTGNNENDSKSGTDPIYSIRAENVAKLQDVLYCDHGSLDDNSSINPEIEAMQVFGIGEETLCPIKKTEARFNMVHLNSSIDCKRTVDQEENFVFEALDMTEPEALKLASGDSWDPNCAV